MSDDWGEGTLPSPASGQRASDDDRQQVVARLREAAGEGVLRLDELEIRLDRALAARTVAELDVLTGDLPEPPPATPPRRGGVPALRNGDFQRHLTVYLLVIGMLVGIWALGGAGHFWPFYPAAGWGIGLGSHFMAANQAQRRAERRRERRSLEAREPRPAVGRAPTTRSADAGVRRFVVAMFVDVVGSTGLNEVLGDEGWVRVRERLRTMLAECFAREGGWEVNSAGDGILARFDHPNGAACAASEILRRLQRQREETGFAPSVRIGIHSGDAVEDGDDLIGTVINIASRVTSAAEPDQIIVTEHVADHLDATLHTEDRGIHSLRGVSRPRHLLALDWH